MQRIAIRTCCRWTECQLDVNFIILPSQCACELARVNQAESSIFQLCSKGVALVRVVRDEEKCVAAMPDANATEINGTRAYYNRNGDVRSVITTAKTRINPNNGENHDCSPKPAGVHPYSLQHRFENATHARCSPPTRPYLVQVAVSIGGHGS